MRKSFGSKGPVSRATVESEARAALRLWSKRGTAACPVRGPAGLPQSHMRYAIPISGGRGLSFRR
jgi:hypothetical protein